MFFYLYTRYNNVNELNRNNFNFNWYSVGCACCNGLLIRVLYWIKCVEATFQLIRWLSEWVMHWDDGIFLGFVIFKKIKRIQQAMTNVRCAAKNSMWVSHYARHWETEMWACQYGEKWWLFKGQYNNTRKFNSWKT